MKPVCIKTATGTKSWYLNGKIHREDGPAVEYANGDKSWCLNGELHREDGAAIEWSNNRREWFYKGKKIECSSQEEFVKIIKMKVFL